MQKVMGPLVEAYGRPAWRRRGCRWTMSEPGPALPAPRACASACRSALGVNQPGPVRAATDKASRILTLAALQFKPSRGWRQVWLPEDLRRVLGVARASNLANRPS